jgi:hypothetical protein
MGAAWARHAMCESAFSGHNISLAACILNTVNTVGEYQHTL